MAEQGADERIRKAQASARESFDHAVEIEKAAIKMQETAAKRFESIAEQHSGTEIGDDASVSAGHARRRAESARQRLREDGVDPDS